MLKRLFSVLKGEYPLEQASGRFHTMLELAREMMLEADAMFWGKELTPDERTALYEKDVRLNKLQRQVRKAVITSLSGPTPSDVPYGLLLMSLVKDIERLGDYAKNLTEVAGMTHPQGNRILPEDEITGELRQISEAVMQLAREAQSVYSGGQRERARELTVQGRGIAKRCDRLVMRVAQSEYSAALAVDLTLSVRFYKRLQGHLLNLLSSVLMPLHKLDYYDESSLTED
jgi:phosphate uptake regulator